ncbi:hypothetical protein CC1G_11498 [Coprinopsis cinerea okayama7|uniref:Uncharacterized protein n=1 Tax=Coprinopsis cinerea (strain Okayama-7 / 130 / ATCC MYA-4618 / FGSC 9003) TaxID=240176 RepID=A8NH93_COPC7|nr:hypothetical protein CC1G_11498 [Coprinopsis cinerea okayama7\|eukprot:XP_001833713.2 hypothetical protein CC1G_11498 [Coprinopsis cinerea okayama7\
MSAQTPQPIRPEAFPLYPAPQSPVRRLQSPISLFEPQNIAARRRPKVGSHALRRRRGNVRHERHAHPFDSLPWISALETSPKHIHPCDIADLSLIPDSDSVPNPGPGPVRRRKTSLRSSPLDDPESPPPSGVPLPLPQRDTPTLPVTPKSKPSLPSRILFRNLMPVSANSPSCINIQSLEL